MARRFTRFDDFWLHYLREHARPATRRLHYLGTSLAVAAGVIALVSQRLAWLWLMPVAGYAFAWVAHLAVEKNRPATFSHPLWSLIADFRMWLMWIGDRLDRELDRAGVQPPAT